MWRCGVRQHSLLFWHTSSGGRRTKRLVPASGSLRVTTPCWPETSSALSQRTRCELCRATSSCLAGACASTMSFCSGPACVSTSVMWLCKHWNFSYLSVQCCPFHAALGVAFETLKTQKKEPELVGEPLSSQQSAVLICLVPGVVPTHCA